MIWQDIVISIANLFFSLSLVNQVYCGYKEKNGPIKTLTSVPTFLGSYAICYAFWTMQLYYSSALSFVIATLWLLLFVQRIIYDKK